MAPSKLLVTALLVPMLALAQEQPGPLAPAPPAPPPPAPVYPAVPVNAPPPATIYPAVPVNAPPPAPAPQAPAPMARRPFQRDSWYIGFGVGTGSGSVTFPADGVILQGKRTFSDMNANQDTANLFLNFKVGATLSPTLLLGFDMSAVRAQANQNASNSLDTAVQISNYDAVVTWFPMERGLLLRGGAGLSVLTWDLDALGAESFTGGNLILGGGYAFWLGQSFNLTANLDLMLQSYGDSTNGPESSATWALWVGFDWY